jgi:hypothetical protein
VETTRQEDAAPGCTQMPASYEFVQDVAIVGRLAVGQGCPVDPKGPRIWANGNIGATGDISATGNLRVDRTIAAQDLGFTFGPRRQTSEARLKADNSAVLGLDGALRISRALGIGTPAGVDQSAGHLVVQGTSADATVPLQAWRTADGSARVAVDAVGRLGVGTATPSASLSVSGTFLVQLSGLVKGYDDKPTLTGNQDTRFDTELKVGSTLSIPALSKAPTTFRVVSIKDAHELQVDKQPGVNFDDQRAFTDAPLLTVSDGLGTDLLSLTGDGTLTIGAGVSSISRDGVVRAKELVSDGVVRAKEFVGVGAAVTGMIVMWSGAIDALPAGWALCDGQDGRPDLRSRFVVGAGSDYQPKQSGPADVHTHPVAPPATAFKTADGGAHTHRFPPEWYQNEASGGGKTLLDTRRTPPESTAVQTAGGHAHAGSVSINQFTSGSSSGQNRPAWYALAYIVKL